MSCRRGYAHGFLESPEEDHGKHRKNHQRQRNLVFAEKSMEERILDGMLRCVGGQGRVATSDPEWSSMDSPRLSLFPIVDRYSSEG